MNSITYVFRAWLTKLKLWLQSRRRNDSGQSILHTLVWAAVALVALYVFARLIAMALHAV